MPEKLFTWFHCQIVDGVINAVKGTSHVVMGIAATCWKSYAKPIYKNL